MLKKSCLVLFIIVLLTNFSWTGLCQTRKVNNNGMMLIFTSAVNGNLRACNCPTKPYGGIAPRATLIKQLRNDKLPSLLVDSGDLFSGFPYQLETKYIIQTTKAIGYDAIGIGDQEFTLGLDYLNDLITSTTTPKLPLVSANIFIPETNGTTISTDTSKLITQPYILKNAGKYRVLVTSIISPDAFDKIPKEKINNAVISDTKQALKIIINEFRKKVDLIIVLAHMNQNDTIQLIKDVDGIDIVVGGHTRNILQDPLKINDTIYVHPGGNSEYVGMMLLYFNNKNKIVSYMHELLPVKKNLPEDAEILKILQEYDKELISTQGNIISK